MFVPPSKEDRSDRTSEAPISPAMAAYSDFLDDIYIYNDFYENESIDPKGGPTLSAEYTKLAVVKKEKVERGQAVGMYRKNSEIDRPIPQTMTQLYSELTPTSTESDVPVPTTHPPVTPPSPSTDQPPPLGPPTDPAPSLPIPSPTSTESDVPVPTRVVGVTPPSPSPPTDHPSDFSLSGTPTHSASNPPIPSPTSRVLTGSDLPTLMTILSEAAHITFQLGVQLDVGVDLLHSLELQALKDPFVFLSLVLSTRLKRTTPPATVQVLVDAISRPPISDEALGLKILEHFK